MADAGGESPAREGIPGFRSSVCVLRIQELGTEVLEMLTVSQELKPWRNEGEMRWCLVGHSSSAGSGQ